MRNLKRALSLLLSSTMVLGMLVMGGSAAGYQDVDASNDHQEAIEVLQTVGIMTGDQNGNFNPDGSITRNEMAVVMAHLLNLDYDYYRGTNPFTDVPEWAAPYVAACAAEGVVAGIGNGQFGGDQKVTAAQASLMIMKALGYFQNAEDFGTDWQVATIRQASYINLFNNINATAESALTRGQVAQLVLNGLKAKMVDFTGDKGIQIGDVTVGYKAEYTYKTSAAAKYNTIDDGTTNIAQNDQYYIQLGEELYNGDLKLKNSSDVFGRPARYWEYDGKEIGTYAKYELIAKEYTTKVTGKDLYELLGKSTIEDYGFALYIDGESEEAILNDAYFTAGNLVKGNTDAVGETGNGVLTQVFVDNQNKDITVVIINTYLAKASKDYDEKKEEAEFTIWGINEAKKDQYVKDVTKNNEELVAAAEDFDVEDVAEGDIVLVNVADGAIQAIVDPEVLADTEITAFKNGYDGNLTVDGTKYNYSDAACYDGDTLTIYTSEDGQTINLKDTTYNVYLDQYGYVMGVEEVDPAENFVFVTGIDTKSSNLSNKTADVSVIFLDGTMKVVEVDTKKSSEELFDGSIKKVSGGEYHAGMINTWCSYTVNDEGVYTLTIADNQYGQSVSGADKVEINKKHISLKADDGAKYVYGNDDTVYLNVSLTNIKDSKGDLVSIIDDVDSVTTGIKNTDLEVVNVTAKTADGNETAAKFPGQEIYTLWGSNGYIRATVVIGEDQGVSSNYAYVTSGSVTQEAYDKTTKEYTWSREVAINGELTEITYVGDTIDQIGTNGTNKMEQGEWYKVTYYADGTVKNAVKQDFSKASDEFMSDINEIETAVKLDKTLVLHQIGMNGSLKYENGSLYYVTNDKTGFSVSPEVKVVLANADGKGNEFGTVSDEYTGYKGLEDAIDDLNTNFKGELNAIIEGGVATSIIINCTEKDPGYNPGEVTGSTDYAAELVVGQSDKKVTLVVKTKDGKTVSEDVEYTYTMTSSSLISDSKTSVSGEGKIATSEATSYVKFGTPNQMLKYQAVVTIGNDTIETNVLFG